jgi:hypothetical protein
LSATGVTRLGCVEGYPFLFSFGRGHFCRCRGYLSGSYIGTAANNSS